MVNQQRPFDERKPANDRMSMDPQTRTAYVLEHPFEEDIATAKVLVDGHGQQFAEYEGTSRLRYNERVRVRPGNEMGMWRIVQQRLLAGSGSGPLGIGDPVVQLPPTIDGRIRGFSANTGEQKLAWEAISPENRVLGIAVEAGGEFVWLLSGDPAEFDPAYRWKVKRYYLADGSVESEVELDDFGVVTGGTATALYEINGDASIAIERNGRYLWLLGYTVRIAATSIATSLAFRIDLLDGSIESTVDFSALLSGNLGEGIDVSDDGSIIWTVIEGSPGVAEIQAIKVSDGTAAGSPAFTLDYDQNGWALALDPDNIHIWLVEPVWLGGDSSTNYYLRKRRISDGALIYSYELTEQEHAVGNDVSIVGGRIWAPQVLYDPFEPANWEEVPSSVQQALDMLIAYIPADPTDWP